MVAQSSLLIAYGIDVAPRDDPTIALTDEALRGVYVAQNKGRIFNYVPFCTSDLHRVRVCSVTLGQSFTFRGGSLVLALRRMLTRTSTS